MTRIEWINAATEILMGTSGPWSASTAWLEASKILDYFDGDTTIDPEKAIDEYFKEYVND